MLGAGPIGLFAAQVLQFQGIREVVVQDVNAARLALATRCGIRRCALGVRASLEPSLKEPGPWRDAVVEATGLPDLVSAALAVVPAPGRRLYGAD